ncbi:MULTISPECIES: ABC transporter substrate-binding protein [unclassified Novosphingobium]|uniref:ABC transporter substrate-binding protein n=1 Tax=unclassified Novosphingobium TaxID=2644732 RepID=UPI000EC4D938|nr:MULTISPECIES: ABC transporter substrate-binding protein [unclassified Novosphingobium]HCF25601.1 iron ABC transporter substrate-binding protein [Novosphingobium sp.]HQV04753.1 ABC transporter substrate-binding protein [Novosphingobium sp.]
MLLPILLAACSPAAPPQVKAPQNHPTIVSLNPCTDAILAEVADPQQLLAISSYSQDPASSSMDLARARAMTGVSGTVEEVLALRPQVVVGSSFTAPGTRMALERLGYRFEAFGLAGTIAENKAQIRSLARIAGHPERGEALVRQIDAALAAAAPPPGPPVPTVVWQSGGIVPGEGTLITELLARTGFVNFAAQKGLHQAEMLPLEVMLADPPRLILAAGNTYSEEDRLLSHPALAGLTRTRRERLDPVLLWCGGPTIIKAAERLAQVRRSL